MAIKFQYNKTSLQQLEKQLKMRERSLPTIKSKESALRIEVKRTKDEVNRLELQLEQEIQSYENMVALWNEFNPELIAVKDVSLSTKKIAGVIGTDKAEGNNVGYLIDAGTKLYETSNDKEVTGYYTSVLYPDGNTETHKADKDYSDYKNSVVRVDFKDEKAVISRHKNGGSGASGTFNASSWTWGGYTVSKDVEILDVSTIDSDDSPLYVTVKPQRLDGVTINSNSVLYCEINEKNAVTKLILKGVTGDYYSYGYVTKTEKNFEMMMGTYEYTFDGTIKTHASQGSIYGVSRGPAKITVGAAGIEGMQNISKISGDITEINNTYVTVGGTHYLIADDVKIFYPNSDWDYMLLTMDDILGKDSQYVVSGVYHDKASKQGGRVRIIIVRDKVLK